MEVLAVSHSTPKQVVIQGLKLNTSIVHDPLTSPSDYIELNESGVLNNQPAAHDGPVYVYFAENYDYWCSSLGVERLSWGLCHMGENITLRYKEKVTLEDEIHLGDIWRIGESVRLQVCGARIPCMKLSWRCGQPSSWLKTLADSGRVGVYLRVIQGGRIHPGDEAWLESSSGDAIDVATVTRAAFDMLLKTRDTLNILSNHTLLMRMNKRMLAMKLNTMNDKETIGKNAWKGWRDLRMFRVEDEAVDIKSFYLKSADDENKPLANYLPGQFLTIRMPDGKTRSWTISDFTALDGPQYYRLSIKRAGKWSSWMHDKCVEGSVVTARSPAGRFVFDVTAQLALRQVYISAGIGITPMLAMAKAHSTHPNFAASPALWIHVARDGRSLPKGFRDEMSSLKFGYKMDRHIYFTHPTEDDILGVHYDHRGRPEHDTLKKVLSESYKMKPFGTEFAAEAKLSSFYVCGPPGFQETIKACLGELGVPPPFIHSESFSASGAALGDVKRAVVRFTRSEVSANWSRDAPLSLLELAESAGLRPDYGCRVGACGSCVARLKCGSVSGGVQVDGSVLTCSAVPASEVVEVEL